MPLPIQKLKESTLANFNDKEKQVIQLYEQKKIRYYNNDDFIAMMKEFNKLCEFIGITEPPSVEVWKMLAEYLKEYHGDFSRQEIIKAFNMAIAGRLTMEFKHFNRLTPQLFSEVIREYGKYRGKIVSNYLNENNKQRDNYLMKLEYDKAKK